MIKGTHDFLIESLIASFSRLLLHKGEEDLDQEEFVLVHSSSFESERVWR